MYEAGHLIAQEGPIGEETGRLQCCGLEARAGQETRLESERAGGHCCYLSVLSRVGWAVIIRYDLRQVLTIGAGLLETGVNKYTLDAECFGWPKVLWVGGEEQQGLWF